MPSARQGDIHDYDFGPVIGAELSGRRPALIISTDEFNGSYRHGDSAADVQQPCRPSGTAPDSTCM